VHVWAATLHKSSYMSIWCNYCAPDQQPAKAYNIALRQLCAASLAVAGI